MRGSIATQNRGRLRRGRRKFHRGAADMMTTLKAPKGATCRQKTCRQKTWRQTRRRFAFLLLAVALIPTDSPSARDGASATPQPLPALANPDDPGTPAKELFGRKTAPAKLETRTIGFYSKGCLAGGMALPINGRTWQVMRLSRNRNWGHPNLIKFLESLADQGPKTGWGGPLGGETWAPRGGPRRHL